MCNISGNKRKEVPLQDGGASPKPRTVSISNETQISPYASPACLSHKQKPANTFTPVPANVFRPPPISKKPRIIRGSIAGDLVSHGMPTAIAIHGSVAGDLMVLQGMPIGAAIAPPPPQGGTDLQAISTEEELENIMLGLSPSARDLCTPTPFASLVAAENENPPNVAATVSPGAVKVMIPGSSRAAMPPLQGGTDFKAIATEEDPAARDLCTPTPTAFTVAADAENPPGVAKVSPESQSESPKKVMDAETVKKLSYPKPRTVSEDTASPTTMKDTLDPQRKDTAAPKKRSPRFSPSEKKRIYLAENSIKAHDVYCGREERGARHQGNVVFRRIILGCRERYIALPSKPRQAKTNFSNHILQEKIKGRFVAKAKGGRFYLLTEEEAREKVRQALSEKKKN